MNVINWKMNLFMNNDKKTKIWLQIRNKDMYDFI